MKKKLFLRIALSLVLGIFMITNLFAQTPKNGIYHNTGTGRLSLYLDGVLRDFPDMNTFFAVYSGNVDQLGRTKYTNDNEHNLKFGPKLSAGIGLYQVSGKPEIYFLDDMGTGTFVYRHIVSMEVLNSYGFNMALVKQIPALDKPVGIPFRDDKTGPAMKIHYNTATGRLSLYLDGVIRDFNSMDNFYAFYSGDVNQLGKTSYSNDAQLTAKFGPKMGVGSGLYQVSGKPELYILDDCGTGKLVYRHIVSMDVINAYGFDLKLIKQIGSLDKPVGIPVRL